MEETSINLNKGAVFSLVTLHFFETVDSETEQFIMFMKPVFCRH